LLRLPQQRRRPPSRLRLPEVCYWAWIVTSRNMSRVRGRSRLFQQSATRQVSSEGWRTRTVHIVVERGMPMKRILAALTLVFACTASTQAAALFIPEDRKLPPLAMVHHVVTVTIDDQAAVTKVEQSFRNHTDRQLEATYVFPVPKGASVKDFRMEVNGKFMKGELLPAEQARK